MGLGKVVIGTNGASFEELITDGVNGFLVEPNNPDALADKLISAWVDPKLNEMSAAAKQRMREFAPEKTVTSLLNYYSEVLNRKTKTRSMIARKIQNRIRSSWIDSDQSKQRKL